jgi:MbtH protein
MEMQNPFDDQDCEYLVLINDEKQYSLWPADLDVPDGWTITHGKDGRAECLEYIEENWTDMRPASLVRLTDGDAARTSLRPVR